MFNAIVFLSVLYSGHTPSTPYLQTWTPVRTFLQSWIAPMASSQHLTRYKEYIYIKPNNFETIVQCKRYV